MNALAIPQPTNVTPLHPRLCAHCKQKPVYAAQATYCGKSCTDKAYRARKREKAATIVREQSQAHRVEQLIAIVERQAEQIAALTALIHQQPTPAPQHITNVEPRQAAAANDLLKIETSSDTNGGRNLLNQLLEVSQSTAATKKPKRDRSVTGSPKKIAAAQPVATPNFDDLIAEIAL